MGHNRVRPKYVQAERAVISSGIPVASARGMSMIWYFTFNKTTEKLVNQNMFIHQTN